MSTFQRVIIVGNVGKDPEVRYTPNGTAVCNLSIATSRQWKDKHSGEKQEETEWHRVTFYDRLAEIVGEYIDKGSKLLVEGRLKTRKWTDKEGKDQYTTEIIAEQMQMLGEKKQRDDKPAPPPPAALRPEAKTGGSFDDMDSDLPF